MSRRILVVSQTFPPEMGGNASRIGDTTTYLAEEDWDVTVVAPPPCYPPGQFDRSWSRHRAVQRDRVTVHRLWAWQPTEEDPGVLSRAAYYLTFALHAAVWVLLNGGRFDAILTSTPPIFTGIPGIVGRLAHRLPWVVDVRDLWIDAAASLEEVSPGEPLLAVSRAFQRLVFGLSDRALTTTPELRSKLAAKYSTASPEETAIVPNGVDVSRFTSEADSTELRVVYAGNIGHAQNLESCIRAMEHVESDVTFEIVGDGDRRSALEDLTADLGLGDRVEFVGLVDRDRVPDLLASSAVGVAPIQASEELSYAVPTKAYEYMASGIPVVATGTGAVERLLSDADAGVVVPDDPEALAAAFDDLATDPDRRRRLGRNGRRYVDRNRDRAEIARALSDELDDLVGASAGAARTGAGERADEVQGEDGIEGEGGVAHVVRER
jgi:glycosyltransferase involved in cell wall biosynthesis